jgi:hypothetical protein
MSVLSIDNINELQLQTQTLVGRSVAVLGITGSGKTNTAAVLIEELLSKGLPLTIVDIEGEYWGLKERFEILVAGHSPHVELEIGPENADQLAEISVKRSISVILDLSDFTQEDAYVFLLHYFSSLWTACSLTKQPYQIVLEEAHEFIPQGIRTPLKQILTRIALRGRKRGLGIILISQRSAKVEKDVLTQASLLFLHKVVHPIDLKVYKDLIPLPTSQVEDMVRRLQLGEAIVINNHQVSIVKVRLRHTFHAGSTPTLSPVAQPKLRKLDAAMLKELRTLISNIRKDDSRGDEREKLVKKVKELEEIIVLKNAEIQRLQSQVDSLSKLNISFEELNKSLQLNSPRTSEADSTLKQKIINSELGSLLTPQALSPSTSAPSHPEISLGPTDQRKFDSLIKRVQKLPKLHRSILRLLCEHNGTSMTIPTIATWLSLNESTVRSRPPHDLLKMNLITRERSRDGYKYKSSLHAYLQAEFPNIEPDLLIIRLFK